MRRRVAGFFRGPKVGNIAPIRLTKPARAGDGAEPPAPTLQQGERVVYNTVDELTVNYEEEGILKVKEVDKEVLSKGAWATVLFRYQEWIPETDGYGPDKYTIRRYKKSGGEYRQQSKFTISSADQARRIVAALERWLEDGGNED